MWGRIWIAFSQKLCVTPLQSSYARNFQDLENMLTVAKRKLTDRPRQHGKPPCVWDNVPLEYNR
jgi:hypothetical protein